MANERVCKGEHMCVIYKVLSDDANTWVQIIVLIAGLRSKFISWG